MEFQAEMEAFCSGIFLTPLTNFSKRPSSQLQASILHVYSDYLMSLQLAPFLVFFFHLHCRQDVGWDGLINAVFLESE